jgi:hypothetical protein
VIPATDICKNRLTTCAIQKIDVYLHHFPKKITEGDKPKAVPFFIDYGKFGNQTEITGGAGSPCP